MKKDHLNAKTKITIVVSFEKVIDKKAKIKINEDKYQEDWDVIKKSVEINEPENDICWYTDHNMFGKVK